MTDQSNECPKTQRSPTIPCPNCSSMRSQIVLADVMAKAAKNVIDCRKFRGTTPINTRFLDELEAALTVYADARIKCTIEEANS